ncbi:MAG: SpoIIE family protein phosphatase, partial [Bacteroidota bacterium]
AFPNQATRKQLGHFLKLVELSQLDSVQLHEASTLLQCRKQLRLQAMDLAFIGTNQAKKNPLNLVKDWMLMYPHCQFVLTSHSFQAKIATFCQDKPRLSYLVLNGMKAEDFQLFFQKVIQPIAPRLEPSLMERLVEQQYQDLIKQRNQMERLLQDIETENRRKTRELAEARTMQIAMLPKGRPNHRSVEMEAYMHTAMEVGGDYYDFVEVSDDHLLAVIGDATGHGFKAGIVVATVKSYFQAFGRTMPPAELMMHISTGIQSLGLRNMYMGLCMLEIKGTSVTIWSSGIPPLFHYTKATHEVRQIRIPGMFLGSSILPNLAPRSCHLAQGDILVAMTDGLPEGIERFQEAPAGPIIEQRLLQANRSSAKGVLYELMSLCLQWRKKETSKDDITLLVFMGK